MNWFKKTTPHQTEKKVQDDNTLLDLFFPDDKNRWEKLSLLIESLGETRTEITFSYGYNPTDTLIIFCNGRPYLTENEIIFPTERYIYKNSTKLAFLGSGELRIIVIEKEDGVLNLENGVSIFGFNLLKYLLAIEQENILNNLKKFEDHNEDREIIILLTILITQIPPHIY